jgi:hypothetical protein
MLSILVLEYWLYMGKLVGSEAGNGGVVGGAKEEPMVEIGANRCEDGQRKRVLKDFYYST